MKKIVIFTHSVNHLNQRIFISRIDINGDLKENIKTLANIEISEQYLLEINNIIKSFSVDDEIKIYCMSAYLNKNNNLKEKWCNSDEGKELLNLIKKYNVSLSKYTEETMGIKEEITKIMTTNKNSKIEDNILLKQCKIYNCNAEFTNIIDIYLRGVADVTKDGTGNGRYVSLISANKTDKIITGKSTCTTSNKMLLTALIESIKILKKPCLIRMYTHSNIGLSGGNINKELKEELYKLIKENNHSVVEIVSNKKQEYLETLFP